MGLEDSGLRLRAEGGAEFARALAGANQALAGFTGAIGKAGAGMSAFSQVVIGGLREVGAIGVRALTDAGRAAIRFGQDILAASLKGSEFERAMGAARASLVEVTRVTLDPFFDQLAGLVDKATPSLLGVAQRAGEYLGGIGQNALTWGANVSTQFAQGLIDGAGAVIDALMWLGNLIAGWLMPGSPPKLLPSLDDWGTAAAESWLSGWKRASFDIFRDMAGTLESLIRSVPIPAGGDKSGIVPRILGAREGIARAVDELRTAGQVSAATMDEIIRSVGTADASVRRYIESLIGVQAASAAVQAAQGEVNRVTQEYQDLLKPIDDQLAGIDEAQRQFTEDARISQLKLIESDPNATLAEKQMARFEIEKLMAERQKRGLVAEKAAAIDTAQAKLDAAVEAKAAADNEFAARKAQIDLLAEQNKYLTEQARILEQLAGAGGAGGGGTSRTKIGSGKAKGPGGIVKPDTSWIDDLISRLTPLQDKFEALKETWAGVWSGFMGIVDTWKGPILENVTTFLEQARTFWNRHGQDIVNIAGLAFRLLLNTIGALLTGLTGLLAFGMQIINGDWAGAWNTLKSTAVHMLDIILSSVGQDWKEFSDTWASVFTLMSATLSLKLQEMSAGLSTWLNETADSIVQGFLNVDWAGVGHGIVAGIIAGLANAGSGLIGAAVQLAQSAAQAAMDVLDIHSPSGVAAKQIGLPFGLGIAQGIIDSIALVEAAATQVAGAAIAPPASPAQIAGQVYNNQRTFAPVMHYSPQYVTPARGPAQDYAIWQTLIGAPS